MKLLEQYGLEIGHLIAPYFVLLVMLFVTAATVWFVKNLVVWFGLKARGYREGEEVYLNGTPAEITKIGFLSTRFRVQNGEGIVIRTPSVSNSQMDGQRIERISLKLSKLDKLSIMVEEAKRDPD